MAGPKLNINSILSPELLDAFGQLKLDISRTLNCVKVGQIQSFDGSKQTAQVQLLFKRVLNDGSIADYPVLVDCPVFTLQGGGAALQMPIAAGDQAIVLFADRNLDAWFANGAAAAPFDARCHDLSDGMCLVGVNALTRLLSGYPADHSRLFFGTSEIKVYQDKIILSSSGATIALESGLISIANGTTNMLALMNAFIDILAALTVQDGSSTLPLTAAAIAALEAFKLQVAELYS